jgi:hypothetical protein
LLVCIWEKCKGDCNSGGDLKNTLFIVKDVPIWVLQNSLLLQIVILKSLSWDKFNLI